MRAKPESHRRDFIKIICTALVGCPGGAVLNRLFVSEVAAQSAGGDGYLILDIQATGATALQNTNGSIYARVPGMAASFPQLIVTRLANNVFQAVTSRCTHQGCTVGTYNGSNLVCPCHGSVFTASGVVVSGPAQANLTNYPATFQNNRYVRIKIPGLGYTMVGALAPAGAGKRIRLVFPSVVGTTYQIMTQTSLTGTKSVAPFFTSPTGTTSQTSISGTGGNITVYLDPPPSPTFFVVAAK